MQMAAKPKDDVKITKAKPDDGKCGCVAHVDGLLAKDNAKIVTHWLWGTSKITTSGPSVCVAKIDSKKRSKLPNVLCSYCPFCGKKIKD